MVIAKITAGLGNQLFQYACARAVSLRTGSPLRFDLGYYDQERNRAYRLDAYELPARRASRWELARYLTPFHALPGVRRVVEGANRRLPFARKRIVHEVWQRFDARIPELRRPVYLSGFWQCERYFDDHAAVIREELSLHTPVPDCYRAVLAQIEACEAVALIVRRGDYLQIPNTQGICTLDYYRRALDLVTSKVPTRRVFVFSDDIPWCRENLAWEKETVFVPNQMEEAPEELLRVLARCRHFVLANSSFAWWGGWLGRAPGKIIVAPSQWMRDNVPFEDIMPETWLKI